MDNESRGRKQKNSQKIQVEEEILSTNDWHVLLKESKCTSYKKNDIIVKEGEWATSIYQIGKGRQVEAVGCIGNIKRCRAEKVIDGNSQVLGVMETGEIFGEIGLLQGLKTTASVIADEDDVEVYVVEGSVLRILFFRIPALAGLNFCDWR